MDWISLSFLFSYDQYWSVLSVVVYHMFHMSVRRHHWPECLETSAQRVLMLLKMSVVLCTCVLLASYIHNLYLPISRILFLSQCVLTHSLLTLSLGSIEILVLCSAFSLFLFFISSDTLLCHNIYMPGVE